MHQVKIFKSLESACKDLEAEINAWLKEEEVRVIEIFGNIAPQSPGRGEALGASGATIPSDVFVTILYERN